MALPSMHSVAAALVVAASLSSCSGFRALTRDIRNASLQGDPAPGFVDGTWVGDAPAIDGDWYLVAFLLPG